MESSHAHSSPALMGSHAEGYDTTCPLSSPQELLKQAPFISRWKLRADERVPLKAGAWAPSRPCCVDIIDDVPLPLSRCLLCPAWTGEEVLPNSARFPQG